MFFSPLIHNVTHQFNSSIISTICVTHQFNSSIISTVLCIPFILRISIIVLLLLLKKLKFNRRHIEENETREFIWPNPLCSI